MRYASSIVKLAILLLLSACSKDEIRFDPHGDRYLPLKVGNYWKLEPRDPMGYFMQISVEEEVSIHGRQYFKIHQLVDPGTPEAYEGNIYYRLGANNRIYQLIDPANTEEVIALELGAPDGYKWERSGYTVTVRTDRLPVGDEPLAECKSFYFDIPSTVDEEHSLTLASGVGYLQIHASFGRSTYLITAMIDGVEYDF